MPNNDLDWREGKTPLSRQFDDIYFSPSDGLAESRYVFLEGIGAPDIWQDQDQFCIAECGFGTGLNFLMTAKTWLASTSESARLCYITAEKYPLSLEDIRQAVGHWPELADELTELLAHYPQTVPGVHSVSLFDRRIRLILLIGDATASFANLSASVDAWYLDGFAPRKNPDMWTPELFEQIARISHPHAKLATFTAAGFVRRGLEEAGFTMSKRPGFGHKRECLVGQKGSAEPTSNRPPWFSSAPSVHPNSHIAIIGAGIAGMIQGHSLQKAGYQVTIFDQAAQAMTGASGNPVAILDPYLEVGQSPAGQFSLAAFIYALRYYQNLGPDVFTPCGLIKKPKNDKFRSRYQEFAAKNWFSGDFMGPNNDGDLLFPDAGFVRPAEINHTLRQGLNIQPSTRIHKLHHEDGWTLYDDHKNSHGPYAAVIICSPQVAMTFDQTAFMPLHGVKGQISYLHSDEDETDPVICGEGYLSPAVETEDGTCRISGATFHMLDHIPDAPVPLSDADHQENMARAKILQPALGKMTLKGGRASIRYFTDDRLPLCGPVPDKVFYQSAYTDLHHGPKHHAFEEARYQDGLYVMTGLGARGFINAPLLAEIITRQISGDIQATSDDILNALHPGRFLVRQLSKP